MSSPSGAESLPVISMWRLESGGAAGAMTVAREIRAACETVGFFYVRDHGVPLETIESARSACLEFYRRPLVEKLRAGVNEMHRGFVPMGQTVLSEGALTDHKESFTMGLDLPADDPDVVAGRPLMGPNVFPDDMPHMRDAMATCRDAVAACAARLLRAIAIALSLPADFFEAMYDKLLVRLSANYYPPLPPDAPPNRFGTSPHTDYGVITLLWQDDRGGPSSDVVRADGTPPRRNPAPSWSTSEMFSRGGPTTVSSRPRTGFEISPASNVFRSPASTIPTRTPWSSASNRAASRAPHRVIRSQPAGSTFDRNSTRCSPIASRATPTVSGAPDVLGSRAARQSGSRLKVVWLSGQYQRAMRVPRGVLRA